MPDSSGRFRGIAVPCVPWQEKAEGAVDSETRQPEDDHASELAAPTIQTKGSR